MEEKGLLEQEDKSQEREYRFSLWWITHREMLKAIGYILFIALDVGLICFAGWTFTDAFLITFNQEQAEVAQMVAQGQADLNAQTVANEAKPLVIGSAQLFADENNTVDAYAPLSNPNADWWAEFSYAFQSGATSTTPQTEFILPGQQLKPIFTLANAALGGANSAQLVLSNIMWHRVDAHVTGDYPTWAGQHIDFKITNAAYNTAVPFAGKTIGQSTFTVMNASAYSYYSPTFDVLLKRGGFVVGIQSTTLDSLDTGASQDVSISWLGALPAADTVDVEPDINIFDPTIYKALTATPSIDSRNGTTP